MLRLKAWALVALLSLPVSAAAETYLLMAEEVGCMWCARWNAEIGPIYPKTAESEVAPLRRFDIHADDPDVEFARPVSFTPTFILVRDGAELGRIEGYPGDDLFWSMLTILFDRSKIDVNAQAGRG